MARPVQGGNEDTYGQDLNDWLDIGHNIDGTNKIVRTYNLKVFDDTTVVVIGDGKIIFCIPPELNGLNLVDADAYITTNSSSGLVTVQIRNITDTVDILSTRITIDVGEPTSFTAAAQPVINTLVDDVATGDLIAVDVDVAGTGAKGLGVILKFA